tara:strand:+ start:187 stop:1122 length:936 start_codon:yes stop_codon:yes gene_type:complete
MRSSILVGGQAVINGVMMRVPGAYSTAVRAEDGSIKFQSFPYTPLNEKNQILSLPIIRGAVGLYEAMKIGYSTLNWSAEISEESADKKTNPIIESLMNLLAIIFAIGLFMFLPIFSAGYLSNDNPITFNIIAGAIRISIFLMYLILISRLKDVQTLFQYHGAEHKTIFTFEDGAELSYENTQKYKKEHPRCGTSFLFIVMIVAIFSFSIIDSVVIKAFALDTLETIQRLLLHLICMPIVSGFSYEVLKILAKNMDKHYVVKLLCRPGLLLQKITTQEPDKDQIEVAFEALKTAFGDKYESVKGNKYKADAI